MARSFKMLFNFFAGRSKDHFLHARACYLIKGNSPSCLLCPNESFFGRRNYILHMTEKHGIPADLMLCLVCGYLTSKFDNFSVHSPKCFPPLKEEFLHTCPYCNAYFYFEQDKFNPFYLAHINHAHPAFVDKVWSQCEKCHAYFPPEFLKLHQIRNCLSRLVFRSRDDSEQQNESKVKKPKTVMPILPRNTLGKTSEIS